MLHGDPRLVRLGAAAAAIALVAAILGCGSDGGGEDECGGFEPVRVRISEQSFEPDGEPYFVWVWNEQRDCGFSYRFRPSLGTAYGGTCVLELNEYSGDYPFNDRLIIIPRIVGGTCSDLGELWHTGLEPPAYAVVLN